MAAKELDLGNVTGPQGTQGATGPQGPQGVQGVPGRDATVNGYNAVTLEAAGNVALTQEEGAVTIKTSEALDETVKWHSNPNLLDNWYFVGGGSQQGGGQFPINQRGQTEYTAAGYTIDRWRITIDGIRLSLNSEDGSMKLNNAGSSLNSGIVQQVSWEKQDKPVNVTFSVLYKGSIVATLWGTGLILVEKENDTLDMATFSYEIPASADLKNSLYCPYISAGIGKSVQIVAAKLELGDQQTLAHLEGDTWVLNDPPPNYPQELAKCQRYQFCPFRADGVQGYLGPFQSNGEGRMYGVVPTPVTMRKKPVVVLGEDALTKLLHWHPGGIPSAIKEFYAFGVGDNHIQLGVTLEGVIPPGYSGFIYSSAPDADQILFDANL